MLIPRADTLVSVHPIDVRRSLVILQTRDGWWSSTSIAQSDGGETCWQQSAGHLNINRDLSLLSESNPSKPSGVSTCSTHLIHWAWSLSSNLMLLNLIYFIFTVKHYMNEEYNDEQDGSSLFNYSRIWHSVSDLLTDLECSLSAHHQMHWNWPICLSICMQKQVTW
jgi:hypothetical protein